MSEEQIPQEPTPQPEAPQAQSLTPELQAIRDKTIEVLKTVYDPEIPVDIYELGLIYGIEVEEDASVKIKMTLTSPMCPVAESLPPEVEAKVGEIAEVSAAQVDITWEPPWDPGMMSDAARLTLGM